MVIAVLGLIVGGIINTVATIEENYHTDKALEYARQVHIEQEIKLRERKQNYTPIPHNTPNPNSFGNQLRKYDGEKVINLKNKYGIFWTGKVKDVESVVSRKAFNSTDIEIIPV